MKVVLITNIPAPYRVPIYNEIAKKFGDNFLVIFAAKKEPNRKWEISEMKFKHLFLKENFLSKSDGYNYIHNNIEILSILKQVNPDVIITTGFNPTHIYGWLYSVLYKKKHIPMTDGWIISEKNLSIIHKIIRKIVFKTSHAFIGASINSIKLYTSYGVPMEKIFQSHLCIDNKRFENNKTFEQRKYDIMFSGQFIDIKSPLFFVDIAIKLSKKINNLHVLILGDGPLKDELISKLNENNIQYHYAGFVSQEELPEYYSNSKLLLFPTKIDAWGIIVNEAMASGTPVLTTPYAGVINDLLIDGKNGYILDFNVDKWVNKIENILNNQTLWETLSMNAKNRVQEFNFINAANGIINAIEYAYEN